MRLASRIAACVTVLFIARLSAPAQNPGMIREIQPGSGVTNIGPFEILNNTVYFTADDGTHGGELWKCDGSAAGTTMVYDLWPGTSTGANYKAFNCAGTLYMNGNNGVVGMEPFKIAGASAPALVKNIFAETKKEIKHSVPNWFAAMNGAVYFAATVAQHRPSRTNQLLIDERELFRSDGTAAGTVIVKDLDPHGVFGTNPFALTVWNNVLYFQGYVEPYSIYDPLRSVTFGKLMCRSDGTAAGTWFLNSTSEADWEYTAPPTPSGSYLYYRAKTAAAGMELWRTDGSVAGTAMVADIFIDGNADPKFLTDWNGVLYFTAADAQHGRELWKTTGTAVSLVKDINPAGDSNPEHLTVFNGALYFTAAGPTGTRQLWRSDGTEQGTTLVKTINATGDCVPLDKTVYFSYWKNRFPVIGDYFYFAADDGATGLELWRSDGTDAGTAMVKDANPAGASSPENLTAVGGKLIYTAELPATGREPWLYDPSQPVTKRPADAAAPSGWALTSYPNPCAASATVAVGVPEAGAISLRVYDALGREVAVLADGWREAGVHAFTWNAAGLAAGLYHCRLEGGGRTVGTAMLLAR